MPGEGGQDGYRTPREDLQGYLENQLDRQDLNLVISLGSILGETDSARHREVLDFLLAKDDFITIRAIMTNLPRFRGIPPMAIIDQALGSRFPGEVYGVDDAILEQAGVDHAQFIQKLRERYKAIEAEGARQDFEEEREIVRTKGEPQRSIGATILAPLARIGKRPTIQPEARMSFDGVTNLLVADGCTIKRGEVEIEGSRALHGLLDWVPDWKRFLSREVVCHIGPNEYHHYEVTKFGWMYERLIELCSRGEVKQITDECRAEDVVEFVKKFIEKGKAKIIEKITAQQREYFEVTSKADVWRYGNIEAMDMEDYLAHLADRDESCGKLLVHVTKDGLFPKLVEDPKLISAVAVHINTDSNPETSRALSKGAQHDPTRSGFEQTFGISVAVHFSFDDAIEYPQANFACVFASEALFDNYAYLEMDERTAQEGNDVAFGGLTNDYFGDQTHAVDIKKYGFLMVPDRFRDTPLGKALDTNGLRVFYYDGSLEDGMAQLRERIGGTMKKPKLARELKFKRRNGVRHNIAENNPRYAQVQVFNQLEGVSEAAKRGVNIYPEDDYLLQHLGRGGGKGNYFAV